METYLFTNKTDEPDGYHNLEKQNYEKANHLINAQRRSCRRFFRSA